MDFGLNSEQEALQRDVQQFLAAECPISLVRECEIGVGETVDPHEKGYSPQLYHRIAERGWAGISLPVEYGGGGKGYIELAVLFEQMGRVLCPSPQFSSEVLCGQMINTLGTKAQKQKLLQGIIKEEEVFTLAWQEGEGEPQAIATRAERTEGGFVLHGEKVQVPWAHTADGLLILARTSGAAEDPGGLTLFLLDPRDSRITFTPLKSISGDQLSTAVLRGVIIPEESVVGDVDLVGPACFQVINRAKVVKAAETVGLAARAFELALDYSKGRVQFGRPIATFQALQHMLADVATMVDGARLLVYEAAWQVSAGLPAEAEIAAAKAYAGDVAQWVSREAQQIMGGINYMKDRDIQLYYRRAKAAQLSLGGSEAEKERFALLLGL